MLRTIATGGRLVGETFLTKFPPPSDARKDTEIPINAFPIPANNPGKPAARPPKDNPMLGTGNSGTGSSPIDSCSLSFLFSSSSFFFVVVVVVAVVVVVVVVTVIVEVVVVVVFGVVVGTVVVGGMVVIWGLVVVGKVVVG